MLWIQNEGKKVDWSRIEPLWCLDLGYTDFTWQKKKDLEVQYGQQCWGREKGMSGEGMRRKTADTGCKLKQVWLLVSLINRITCNKEKKPGCDWKDIASSGYISTFFNILFGDSCLSVRGRVGFPLTILCFSAMAPLMFLCVCLPVRRHCSICQTWSGHSRDAAIKNSLTGVVMWRSFLPSPSRDLWG